MHSASYVTGSSWNLAEDGRASTQEMNRMALILAVLMFVAALLVLAIAYPWSTYYGNFTFGWWPTLSPYLILSLFLAAVAASTSRLRQSPRTAINRDLMAFFILLVATVMLALLFGPGRVNVPGTRIRGIFFSEWKFVSFIAIVATPLSLLIVGVHRLLDCVRRKR